MTALIVRQLGIQPYSQVYEQMLAAVSDRTPTSADELWLLQHDAVFTQGQAGKAEHVLFAGNIPVVHTDRGGQVTYHGPGQLVIYLLIDLKRINLSVRKLVESIEHAIVDTLQHWNITAQARTDAPGVYIAERKVASLGLRIKNGCSFHGLALNIDMDLEPFQRINPCGYSGMQMTDMKRETSHPIHFDEVAQHLQQHLRHQLNACGANYE